jgi:hypothetical protein
MRDLLFLVGLLLTLGCADRPTSVSPVDPTGDAAPVNLPVYTVLTKPPDADLDWMAADYPSENEQFRRRWAEDAAAFPTDGQRVIELLEIACYADVMCHRIEYPLRVATLDHVRANIRGEKVADALRWIRTSYDSKLPLDTPGDDTGQTHGILVQGMQIRMREYADELLGSEASTETGK